MSNLSLSLAATGMTIGFLHTAAGPDHYVPFVAMSRAGRWSLSKTVVITLLCGLGHVLSSVLIALVCGIPILKAFEGSRGDWAGWALVGLGLAYSVWGLIRAIRNRPHTHFHAHADGTLHCHEHRHQDEHIHVHAGEQLHWPLQIEGDKPASLNLPVKYSTGASMTPWILFTIFIFGPCEALIPLVMYAAAKGTMWTVAWTTLLFGTATLITMTSIVVALCLGVSVIRAAWFERYSHAMAGFVILGCGIAVKAGL